MAFAISAVNQRGGLTNLVNSEFEVLVQARSQERTTHCPRVVGPIAPPPCVSRQASIGAEH